MEKTIELEDSFYGKVREIAQALSEGRLVHGGGVCAIKRGDDFVIETPDEDNGVVVVEKFSRAINCA